MGNSLELASSLHLRRPVRPFLLASAPGLSFKPIRQNFAELRIQRVRLRFEVDEGRYVRIRSWLKVRRVHRVPDDANLLTVELRMGQTFPLVQDPTVEPANTDH